MSASLVGSEMCIRDRHGLWIVAGSGARADCWIMDSSGTPSPHLGAIFGAREGYSYGLSSSPILESSKSRDAFEA
eukprot:1421595-Alexandrium_andersonii.AAC.1